MTIYLKISRGGKENIFLTLGATFIRVERRNRNNIMFKETKIFLGISNGMLCFGKANYPRAKIGFQYDCALMSSFTYVLENFMYHNFK